MERGGPTLAPGPRDLPLQYIDVRDLAAFLLDAGAAGLGGAVNAVSPSGQTTMGELLDACAEVTGGHAELRWTDPEPILQAGVVPWNDLPVWIPAGHEYRWLHEGDVSRAVAAGLRCLAGPGDGRGHVDVAGANRRGPGTLRRRDAAPGRARSGGRGGASGRLASGRG